MKVSLVVTFLVGFLHHNRSVMINQIIKENGYCK
uniref:Uncharacterized protein n=1 Tax=Rhizophora mucronata TaxID=61149 RepID=A0A2P2QPV6_RHIMU